MSDEPQDQPAFELGQEAPVTEIKLDPDLADEITSVMCEEAALDSTARALFAATLPRTVWRRSGGTLVRRMLNWIIFRKDGNEGPAILEWIRPEYSDGTANAWFNKVYDKALSIHRRNRRFWRRVAERYPSTFESKYTWGIACQGRVVRLVRGPLLVERALEETGKPMRPGK